MLMNILLPFAVSLIIAIIAIPAIIKVATIKHLMDEPDSERKLHSARTPTLGGIAIFAGTVFAFSFFSDYLMATNEIKFMTSGLILLFFAGIKDDILLLTPLKKLGVQAASALLITLMGKLYLTNLWGMFEVTQIPAALGIFITFFIIVALINAFNLIDGVNGLAGGLGLIASAFFGTWFYLTEAPSLSILSFSLAGSLLGFLVFNFHRGKIFMGDTGSMLIGFIVSILAIKFIENNRVPGVEVSQYYIKGAPGVAMATVIVPLFDMTRVFFQRILKGKNPFSADRRHVHHMLLDSGWNPTQISLALYLVTSIMILIALSLKEMRSISIAIILAILNLILTSIVFLFKKHREIQNQTQTP
jgi:UDP-N-acetylmuramyl pentapeptide phosphotransferase/UDP-N-acetylglucosamine-1-phosphate transferase